MYGLGKKVSAILPNFEIRTVCQYVCMSVSTISVSLATFSKYLPQPYAGIQSRLEAETLLKGY